MAVETMNTTFRVIQSYCDALTVYFSECTEIIGLISNSLKLFITGGLIILLIYVFYQIRRNRQNFKKPTNTADHNDGTRNLDKSQLSSIRYNSIVMHKDLLSRLEFAADRCVIKPYALHCIDIVVQCPQLINVKSDGGLTPFHRICFHGHTCLIVFMLAKGADPFLTTASGENSLCMAVHHFINNPKKIDFSSLDVLRETGCNFGTNNKWYKPLLEMAFYKKHTKLVKWLILNSNSTSHKIVRCSTMPPTSKQGISVYMCNQ